MRFSTIKAFVSKYETRLSWSAMIAGFIVDNLTLSRIDLWLDNIILSSYLIIAGGSIILFNYLGGYSKTRLFLPYTLQYALGGLFSGFFIFYSRSGALIQSWPFLILLLFLLLGNELFKERYERYVFRISIYFIALFSFFIFFIPVVIGKMGALIFILSGFVSLLVIWGMIRIIEKSKRSSAITKRKSVTVSIIFLYILFNILYFTNIIPPIPLALKDIGVYHNIEKSGLDYVVEKEDVPWYKFYKNNDIHIKQGSSLYGYSAVFAPTKISQRISHVWLFESSDGWKVESTIPFPISGGRDGGYRGYSIKKSLREGKWRLEVRTSRGQIIGRSTFTISYEGTQFLQKVEVKK